MNSSLASITSLHVSLQKDWSYQDVTVRLLHVGKQTRACTLLCLWSSDSFLLPSGSSSHWLHDACMFFLKCFFSFLSMLTMVCKACHFIRRVIWVSPSTPVWMSSSQSLQDNYKVSLFVSHFFPTKTNQRCLNVSATAHNWNVGVEISFRGRQISLYNWVDHKLANEQGPGGKRSGMQRWYLSPSSIDAYCL